MKIVVWKAPKFLRGILRGIFGMKEKTERGPHTVD